MKYKEQVNKRTGEKRWVPIEGSENIVEKINNVPILGGVTKPITKVISGVVAGEELNRNLGTISDSSMNQQRIAREFALMAQREKDPIKKKQLLDRSRMMSQGATSQLEGYVNPVLETMPQDYQNKSTPTTPKEMVGAYGMDALNAGLAVGEAYSLPSMVNSVFSLAKGGVGLAKKGVTKTVEKVSGASTAEKVRKFVQKVNPQVKATDVNYATKRNAIIEFAKKFDKTGKKSAEEILTSASNKREFNLKAIETFFKKSSKSVDPAKLGEKIINGVEEVEVDPSSPVYKITLKNVDKILSKVVDESGKINPTKLYEVYGQIGDKAFNGVKDARPIYKKVYDLIGIELKNISPQARNLIAENDKIRKLLPGVVKTAEKVSKTSAVGKFMGKVKNTAGLTTSVATGYLLLKNLLQKK